MTLASVECVGDLGTRGITDDDPAVDALRIMYIELKIPVNDYVRFEYTVLWHDICKDVDESEPCQTKHL